MTNMFCTAASDRNFSALRMSKQTARTKPSDPHLEYRIDTLSQGKRQQNK